MKRLFAVLTLAIVSTTMYAQEMQADTKPLLSYQRKNEIGVYTEMNTGNSYNNNVGGLQYKRWVKPNKAYKILLGFAKYDHYENSKYQGRVGDTVFEKRYNTNVPQLSAGFGLEMQRHFYKKVYLYAALEVRGAYGRGKYTSYTSKHVQNDSTDATYATNMEGSTKGVIAFMIEARPSIGAKFQFKKISFGTELCLVHLAYQSVSYPSVLNSGGIGDFDMGSLTQRFFFSYRF